MTADEAVGVFLDWLARERAASPLTVKAYAADLAGLLAFLTGHIGRPLLVADLASLSQADLRAWLAHQAAEGTGNATRARHLSSVRSFYRYLARG